MKSIIRRKVVSPVFAIGVLLAVLYVFFVGLNIISMLGNPQEPWHTFWVFLEYLNFPGSLLLRFMILPVYSILSSVTEPYFDRSWLTLAIFITFNLAAGGCWYFCLPMLLDKLSRKFAASVIGRIIVVLLAITPIFCHWLQLLKHIAGNSQCFSPILNSWFVMMWTGLFIWLYCISNRRKRLLWLLCLLPMVFFYFARDLYYYNIYGGWIAPH